MDSVDGVTEMTTIVTTLKRPAMPVKTKMALTLNAEI
jgi:hypothetical protein